MNFFKFFWIAGSILFLLVSFCNGRPTLSESQILEISESCVSPRKHNEAGNFSIISVNSTCMEVFEADDCEGESSIVTGKLFQFYMNRENKKRSFRECPEVTECPDKIAHEIEVISKIDSLKREKLNPALLQDECVSLNSPDDSLLSFLLKFSAKKTSEDDEDVNSNNNCIQLYSSPDCTEEFHRIIFKSSTKVYGMFPNVVQSFSICDCSRSEDENEDNNGEESPQGELTLSLNDEDDESNDELTEFEYNLFMSTYAFCLLGTLTIIVCALGSLTHCLHNCFKQCTTPHT